MAIAWDASSSKLVANGVGGAAVDLTNKHIGGYADGKFLPK